MINLKNKKNKSAVFLSPKVGVGISGASVESVVSDGAKTQCYSAKRDLYGDFAYAQPLKMTVLAFLLSLNLSTSYAAEKYCNCGDNGADNCCWEYDEATKTLTVTGTGSVSVFPWDNYQWDEEAHDYLAQWSGPVPEIEHIDIKEGITTIGFLAFYGCWNYYDGCDEIWGNVKTVNAPYVEEIEDYAFYANLTELNIPAVKEIKDYAFGDSSIDELYLPNVEKIGCGVVDGPWAGVGSVYMPKVKEIGCPYWSGTGMMICGRAELPDNVILHEGALMFECMDDELIISEDVDTSQWNNAFNCYDKCPKIKCKGDLSVCEAKINEYNQRMSEQDPWFTPLTVVLPAGENECTGRYVWNQASESCERRSEEQCNAVADYYFNGEKCMDRPEDPEDIVCDGGYAELKGNCVDPLKTFAKKHYTPAEAAQWLKDEDNEITITFKK